MKRDGKTSVKGMSQKTCHKFRMMFKLSFGIKLEKYWQYFSPFYLKLL